MERADGDMQASQDEMAKARLPIGFRDQCSSLLIVSKGGRRRKGFGADEIDLVSLQIVSAAQ